MTYADVFFDILNMKRIRAKTQTGEEETNVKFFHLSDLHIGLKLYNRDLLNDQKFILQQVVEQAKKEKPDAIVIAGDIYDKAVPSAEAVSVFDGFVLSLKKEVPDTAVMMISGNHDSAPRVNIYRGILAAQKLYMVGVPPQQPEEYIQKVSISDEWGNVNFYLLPFVRPSMVKNVVGTEEDGTLVSYHETVKRMLERENVNTQERNVLVSHQFYIPEGTDPKQAERMDSEIQTVGNIDQVGSSVLEPFDYAALGHIHKPVKVGRDIWRYCGTPFACSVSEAGQIKAIQMIEMREKGDTEITAIPLCPHHEVKVIRGTLTDILEAASDDYVSVVLTDKVDLDVLDTQDRICAAFPNLLEIRRETARMKSENGTAAEEISRDPFELCCAFLKDLSEEEKVLLKDVINTVQEEMQ